MSLFKITQRIVWRSRLRYKLDGVPRHIHHGLMSSTEQSSHPLTYKCNQSVHCSEYPIYASCHQCRIIKTYTPIFYTIHKFSSSRKPLSYTDDLLQKHIQNIVDEWSQLQKQLTGDQCDSGQHSAERLHSLKPIVSKVVQHQQYSFDISELEDIISGAFTLTLWFFFKLELFCFAKWELFH